MNDYTLPTARILFLFIILYIPRLSFSQNSAWDFTDWDKDWKLEIKTGVGAIMTRIPDKYLKRVKNVNLPTGAAGSANILSIKKSFTPHFEIGYQFEYLQINGKVKQEDILFQVKTQALGSNFLILYNLKKTNEYRPPFNYMLYYKIGAVSIKNDPKEIVPKGQFPTKFIPAIDQGFLKNIAVLTGLGIGVNRQLSDKLSLSFAFEINRNSDVAKDIYKVYKLFYPSQNTVCNYSSFTAGLCYTFNLKENKTSVLYNTRTKTEIQLLKNKKNHSKKKISKSKNSIWYKKQ